MKGIVLMAAVAGCMLIGNVVNAQVVQRGDRRMVQGVRNGSLTAHEVKQVNFMKKQLQRDIRMAKADGIVTWREQQMINRRKSELDRMIYMQKHDGQVRRF